ncbi:response regulator transcription factor [uncultured Lamprocystis sp.]|jgi:two-component system response regulator PhoP|uniref:response regulator transcription factor n=1 Tax=uncultured Lamprocystis sp. TaxID=543132 RepID=UPI0025EF93D6|nr:response regulator transcription factor [uncultured Lamprocystis sp.]
MRILVIEDEAALRTQLTDRLVREGFRVDDSGNGDEGLYLATEYPFDAAVVDLGLPGMPGIEIIRRLRAAGNRLPVLVLTARGRWQDKVEGLEAGADDYLAKPFEMEELLARLRALLRRAAGAATAALIAGPVRLDRAGQRVTVDGRPVDLTDFEFRLLERLMTERGRVLSKRELADYLYPHDEDRDSNVLEVLLGRLRRKLDPDGSLAPIETLRGRGYRFVLGNDPV